jgi:hypothetical protein
MPQNPAIDKAVASAKSTLADANRRFPPAKAKAMTPVAKAAAAPTSRPAPLGDASVGPSLQAKQANVQAYSDALPKLHTGGEVPKTGDYKLQAGETVVPASGRQSEYRKVYVARRQKRDGGGNAPVKQTPEKHDQKKAHEGTSDQKDFKKE